MAILYFCFSLDIIRVRYPRGFYSNLAAEGPNDVRVYGNCMEIDRSLCVAC